MKYTGIFLIMALLLIAGCTQSAPAVKPAEQPPQAAPAAAESAPVNEVVIEQNPGPGPYVGTALGYYEYSGTITVTLDVADRVLRSVKIEGPRETAGIGSVAIDTMGEIMLKANSIEIDAVSGATHSSEGVLLAAKRALAKAGLANADLKR